MKVNIDWSGDMAFKADVNGFTLNLDADEKVGGKNTGPRPKPLLLIALGGCTGMDVVSILAKMRVVPDYFNVEIDGEQTDEHPKYYHKIHLKYQQKSIEIGRYIGEVVVRFEYKGMVGPNFGILHVDPDKLKECCEETGWNCEVLYTEAEGPYLAKLTQTS